MPVSAKTIERVVHEVSQELAERRDADPRSDDALAPRCESPPQLAVVECDGGRIRTREPGHGPGVHRTGEGWREDKNACLIRALRTVSVTTPSPNPPRAFATPSTWPRSPRPRRCRWPPSCPRTPADAETPPTPTVPGGLAAQAAGPHRAEQPGRRQDVRRPDGPRGQTTAASSRPRPRPSWATACPGTGRSGRSTSADFTPILDFIHVLSYLFVAAKAVHAVAEDAWDQYLAWMRGRWRGEVAQVLEELRHRQTALGLPPADAPEADPCRAMPKSVVHERNIM